ncbi:SMI1/KNR4 family protein [Flavobacterium sp. ABG]|uniref:SMI1/KNR4 family protein n=1 Tax=Flavobacterium sp. ABG TaxID=1423322 RepID=UPI000AEFA198|nr:SMI1/KNR4 family protein [Flavobacterium sp. ABG]
MRFKFYIFKHRKKDNFERFYPFFLFFKIEHSIYLPFKQLMMFVEQVQRIKNKLIKAKNADVKLKVFGSEEHKYALGYTLNEKDILKFEKEYDLELPECYRTFLTNVGNGGIGFNASGAGPFYGIYPFGKMIEELIDKNTKEYLSQDCVWYPNMTDEYWDEITKNIDEEGISDEDFEIELGKIFSGILPLGSQGCSYIHGLVLNGEFKGRVVNLDLDRQKPKFTFENNFLDWYERWLDEVISGDLIVDTATWFGYSMGGKAEDLLETYFSVSEFNIKKDCLNALLKKAKLDTETLDVIEAEFKLRSGEIQEVLLQILTKFDYNKAHVHLIEYANENLLQVFQFVFWYAKEKSSDWLESIETNVGKINDEETFRFCTYLLKEMNIDYGEIIAPFASNENEDIRVSAYYSLGQLKNKSKYLETFIQGLNDKTDSVVRTALQALDGLEDKKLLIHYKSISERFPKEQNYILVNLNLRLKPFGLTNSTIKNIDVETYEFFTDKNKWYQFWK